MKRKYYEMTADAAGMVLIFIFCMILICW